MTLNGTFTRNGGFVLLNRRRFKNAGLDVPDENIVHFNLGANELYTMMTGASRPGEIHMVYVFDTDEHAMAYEAGVQASRGATMLHFRLGGRFFGGGPGPIEEVFVRRANKKMQTAGTPKGLIAMYRVIVQKEPIKLTIGDKEYPDADWEQRKDVIYVDMMTVKPGWKQQGINTSMMNYFLKQFPGRRIEFSEKTHQGELFAKKWKPS